jgi:alpha-ketoglutarate-dependent taurine dioxygenase
MMKRKPIQLSKEDLIQSGYLSDEAKSPLVLRPRGASLNLIDWASHNTEFIEALLPQHGGILFRDFQLTSEVEFEQVIKAVSEGLLEYTYGSTPRSHVSGRIYTSTEYPSDQAIPLHNEMSYATQWPMKIWFFCLRRADEQGETPIADSRRVFDRIRPDIREQFINKGVMYIRNYVKGLDVPWEQVFHTSSRSEVENYCRKAGIEAEWQGDGQLRTRQVCQATATHPKTRERVWFNQAHLFHASSLRADLRVSLLASVKEEDVPRHACFGDGSPIQVQMLDEIREAYRQETVIFSWQQGDILLLDNMLTAHGRMPFTGPRKILVGMAEPWSAVNGA